MGKLAKFIYFIVFALGVSYQAFAQVPAGAQGFRNPNGEKQNSPYAKLANVKKEYLSKQLNLTSDQSKKFWPLYRQYQQQMVTIRRLKRRNSDGEADANKKIKNDLYYDTEMVNIRKRYNEEFLKILPPEKVSELYKSEREFNDEVIKQLSERSERAGN
ncbi:hypothetical protein EOD41_13725 [Mucilaginibacter limnophilus]|uniref:Sensor of ECF-type sigma factor n=1 Tax=Mucilaginibacter limnophilus TaxID=1932778 RepID=A0A437MQV8_9SPHI|nr:hypothetical protein [Mucilaginibacter limnophilus]RVU00020.1 hypothetical protein EOD41_13725 [Mucilaginibacter limnophilus]